MAEYNFSKNCVTVIAHGKFSSKLTFENLDLIFLDNLLVFSHKEAFCRLFELLLCICRICEPKPTTSTESRNSQKSTWCSMFSVTAVCSWLLRNCTRWSTFLATLHWWASSESRCLLCVCVCMSVCVCVFCVCVVFVHVCVYGRQRDSLCVCVKLC